MFDRKSIKEYARFRLAQHRFLLVIVVLIAGLLGGAASAPSFNLSGALPTDDTSWSEDYTDDSGDTGTVWDDAQPGGWEESDPDESDPDVADPGIWEDSVPSDAETFWNEFKSFFNDPDVGVGMSVLMGIFSVVFVMAFIGALLQTIFLGNIVSVGLNGWLLRYWRGETPSVAALFASFRIYKPSLKAMFTAQLYSFLWSLLFVIPGIIKSYAYALVPYIIYENPNLTANQAIALSEKLTRGYKWKLFVLELSFIWWDLLSAVSLGIVGLLYVNPYKYLTYAGAYEQIKWAALQEGRVNWEDFGQMAPVELWDTPAADIVVSEAVPVSEVEHYE